MFVWSRFDLDRLVNYRIRRSADSPLTVDDGHAETTEKLSRASYLPFLTAEEVVTASNKALFGVRLYLTRDWATTDDLICVNPLSDPPIRPLSTSVRTQLGMHGSRLARVALLCHCRLLSAPHRTAAAS
jgi:hypothetical protein